MSLPRKLPYLLKYAGWKTTCLWKLLLFRWLVSFFKGGNHNEITSCGIYVQSKSGWSRLPEVVRKKQVVLEPAWNLEEIAWMAPFSSETPIYSGSEKMIISSKTWMPMLWSWRSITGRREPKGDVWIKDHPEVIETDGNRWNDLGWPQERSPVSFCGFDRCFLQLRRVWLIETRNLNRVFW